MRIDLISALFLISNLVLISFLTWSKSHFNSSELIEITPLPLKSASCLTIPHSRFDLPNHSFYLSNSPITNEQFHLFTQYTHYKTQRQLDDLYPQWEFPKLKSAPTSEDLPSWITSPQDPVIYITKKDAERFCSWLSLVKGEESPYRYDKSPPLEQHRGFRLPSIDELMCQNTDSCLFSSSISLWTLNNYSEKSIENPSFYADYLGIWSQKTKESYGKESQLLHDNLISFKIAWTTSTINKK